jgi:uncharacterized membrane protein SpoIIM required for sporulation
MRTEQFFQSRQTDWKTLTELLERGQRDLSRLSPDEVETLGRLYRAATSDLAVAQRDYPNQRVTAYLNQLVARAHAVIYRSEPLALGRLWRFVTTGFPRAYRETLVFTGAAALVFIISALIAGIGTAWEPTSARWLLPAEVQHLIPTIEDRELWAKIPVNERPYASSFIMQNNIQVAFLAFASGALAGLPTLWLMVMNGLILGGLTGLTAHYGIGWELWTFVIGHGVIELSVIFVAGGAGLKLGWAILQPGLLRRRDALALAARQAVRLIIGCVPLLVGAGLIEGFISPAENIPWFVKWSVGLGTGAVLYGYWLLAGRDKPRR